MKRFFEKVLSLILLVLGLPFIFLIMVIDYFITRQFPLLFQSRALGSGCKIIKTIKIKTIHDSSPNNNINRRISAELIYRELEGSIPGFCRWMRKSGIDEFFQLLSVLTGEMSLVGPRPLIVKELEIIKKENPHLHKRRVNLNLRPGITGYWQVYGDREKGFENIVESDEFYKMNKSLSLDLRIIMKTIYIMITATHSDAILEDRKIGKKNVHGILSLPLLNGSNPVGLSD